MKQPALQAMHQRHVDRAPTRIGIVGTGMIARSFAHVLAHHHPDLPVTRVLTRRPFEGLSGFPLPDALTHSVGNLIDHADLLVECSGDAVYAHDVVERAFAAGLPVVTMGSELHITTGSYLAAKGYLTEAEGDQPGSLAALHEEAVMMGFKPLVYGNMKGFLNLNPTFEEMQYWSQRQGTSVTQTTSFTDGTKVQIEQAFIANATGATILQRGLAGPQSDSLQAGAFDLAARAEAHGAPIADYLLAKGWPAGGVFLVGRHDADLAGELEYFKLGKGPYYVLTRPFHLCSLEIVKQIRRALEGCPPLMNNSLSPTIGVGAVAKTALPAGTRIEQPIGGFQLRGEALRLSDHPLHVPIGVLKGAVLRRVVEPGQLIQREDVDLVASSASRVALALVDGACTGKPLSHDLTDK
jgi:predicted homoserine dehydrogenase-like protein